MRTRRSQRGYGYVGGALLAILTVLNVVDLAMRFVQTIRRRVVGSASETDVPETLAAYSKRLVRALGPPILSVATLVLLFWAIVHFGPLKPIHEWRQ